MEGELFIQHNITGHQKYRPSEVYVWETLPKSRLIP